MSVLESFLILIESDASQVTDGVKQAKKSTEGLTTSLSNADQVANKLGGSFKNLIRNASGAILAILSAGALVAGIKNAVAYADRLQDLSDVIGVSVEDLSIWGDAVHKNGGEAESFYATLQSVTAQLSSFATKGKSLIAPFFKELGIKMVDAQGKARSFIDILPELADSFQKISKQESFGIGQKIGLDRGTIILLQQGRKRIEEVIVRQKELGVITKENAEISAKFNETLDDTAHMFRTIFSNASGYILPVLTAILKHTEKVVNFIRDNKDLTIGAVIGLSTALSIYLVPALYRVAAGVIAATWPFVLIIGVIVAVVAAFALLYEDIIAFKNGSDSLIGQISEKWPKVGYILKEIGNGFILLWEIAKAVLGFIVDMVYAIIIGVSSAKQAFIDLATIVKGVWNSIAAIVTGAIDKIMGAIDKVINAYRKVKDFLGFGGDTSAELVTKGRQALITANASPLTNQTSNSIYSARSYSPRATSVQIGKIDINTQATDADGVARAVGGSMETQMRQAINTFDDGVAA